MPQRVVYLNGEYVPEREARISIFDSALMYGDMLFEMTRTFGQRPYRLREHLEQREHQRVGVVHHRRSAQRRPQETCIARHPCAILRHLARGATTWL